MAYESLLDRMNEDAIENSAEKYYNRYRDHMQILESHSILGKVRSVTPYDFYALGMQLDAWQGYRRMCEDAGTIAALGTIPNIAMDVIAATYGTSPLSVIASVQPINEEQGTVYYKQVLAETTRNNITAGQSIWDAQSMPQAFLQNYSSSSNTVVIGTTGSSPSSSYTFTVNSAYLPIRPQQFALSVLSYTATDDGNGNLNGNGIWGAINYTTGVVNLYFASTPTANQNVNAIFNTVFEGASSIPQINFQLASKSVRATLYALKNTVGLEQSYAMRKRFGMIAEDELTKDLVASINSEIVNTLVLNLTATVPSANQQTFSYTPGSGVSYLEQAALEGRPELR